MEPLSIIAFLDGRLGHEKQTRGILRSLADRTPIEVTYRTLPALTFGLAIKQWCRYIGKSLIPRKKDADIKADLIIGAGSYTHIPMLLMKRTTSAKVVTCMCPDRILISAMDLCFVPEHDRMKSAENVFITTGPPNFTLFNDRHDPGKGLFLIGGIDKNSHHWDSQAVIRQVKTIIEQESSITWTLSTSPRTPVEMLPDLEALSQSNKNLHVVRYEETPTGWIEQAYSENLTVWVTADSISGIFEALTAGCRVGILPVQWKKMDSKFKYAENSLIKKGWVCSFDNWWSEKKMNSNAIRLDEAGRCAGEILKRWWSDRLR